MKYIEISDYRSDSMRAVTNEAVIKIEEIIKDNRVCSDCGKKFTINNPEVLFNLCLEDALIIYKDRRYIKSEFIECGYPKEKRKQYYFIDNNGKIYLGDETTKDIYYSLSETLKHWQYPVLPDKYIVEQAPKTEAKFIGQWSLWGDITKDTYIMATAQVNYWDKDYKDKFIQLEYVLEKNGRIYELNNRKKTTRELNKQIKEATKSDKWYTRHDERNELLRLLNSGAIDIKNYI